MPHLLVADLAATGNQGLRQMACNACWYLLARGDTRTAYDLAADLRQHWRDRLGDDDENTQAVVGYLAWALRAMGHYAEARELDEDTLDRRRRMLGEDHPDTLTSANNLGNDLRNLGERQAARELDEDTLARKRRVLGEDHPNTLRSAGQLAIDLSNLGEHQAARELDEDTLVRHRRVLGEDHPRDADLGEQPRRRPEQSRRASGGPRARARIPWTAAAACSARTTQTLWPRRATSPST